MKKKSSAPTIIIVILFLIIAAAGLYVSPLLALNNLKNAAIAGDRDKVAAAVDFPAVREDVKSQLMLSLQDEMAKQKDNPFAALGMSMGAAMVNNMVDTFINADGIAKIMKSGSFDKNAAANKADDKDKKPKDDVNIGVKWVSIDSVNVTISSKSKPDQEPVIMRMKRDGLFNWKLVGIKLPLDKKVNPAPQ